MATRRSARLHTAHTSPPDARAHDAAADSIWRRVLHEPLLHFLVLAALLFAAEVVVRAMERERIVIDRPTIEALAAQQAELAGRPLTAAERTALIEGLIDEEVLLREAYRRGLEQDAVVRRHLVQKMRFLLGEDVPEPSEAELRTFLDTHGDRYRMPPTVTLDHVYFADPAKVPDGMLDELRAGAEFRGLGERLYMLGPTLSRYSLRDLIDLFGEDLARQIFEFPAGVWQGPLRSPEGMHFVRVAAKHDARLPAFEEIVNSVREDWRFARQQEMITREVRRLRDDYRVEVEPTEAAP